MPKSHLYRLIRTGEVRVDGKRVKQTRKLGVGEQVRIPGMAVQPKTAARVPDKLADTLAAGIVHEQEDFIVVAKPPGVAVHAGTGVDFGVIDALRQKLDAPALELVHRLDRGTSGALLVARDKGRNRALQQLFRQRSVEKRYLALAACRWPGESTVVDAPLLKNTEHAGERRVIVDQAGQSALTRFSVQERFSEATLLDVLIETGRTHQIRVHARHIACALVGDTRYGDNACNARFRRLGLGRLFLHAARLSFQWQGKAFTIEVPPDDSWEAALETLRRATRKISRPR